MIKTLIFTASFLLAASIYGCSKEVLSDPAVHGKNDFHGTDNINTEGKGDNDGGAGDNESPIVIAYYFHRTVRCHTCLLIEANAARVIEENFSQQISNGTLTWIPFNLDESGGKELEEEFDVSVSTLVLSKMEGAGNTEYKKLEKVWGLIGDPVKFDNYVKNEVKQFLNE